MLMGTARGTTVILLLQQDRSKRKEFPLLAISVSRWHYSLQTTRAACKDGLCEHDENGWIAGICLAKETLCNDWYCAQLLIHSRDYTSYARRSS